MGNYQQNRNAGPASKTFDRTMMSINFYFKLGKRFRCMINLVKSFGYGIDDLVLGSLISIFNVLSTIQRNIVYVKP